MAKYQILFHWPNGEVEEDNNFGKFYDTEDEAIAAGEYGLNCYAEGGEILEMSNPGDYPCDENESQESTFEIQEVR